MRSPWRSFEQKNEESDLHFNKMSYCVENRGWWGKERVETLSGRPLQCSGWEEMVALIKLPAVLVVRKCHIWIYCEENVDSLCMVSEKSNELMLNFFVIITEILNSGFPWHYKESSFSQMPPGYIISSFYLLRDCAYLALCCQRLNGYKLYS